MLRLRLPSVCDGKGSCFRRYTKCYYYKHDNVICKYNCVMMPCSGCNCQFPQWHFDLFSSGKCYDCNKAIHVDEIDSDEEELRSDASLCSGVSIESI